MKLKDLTAILLSTSLGCGPKAAPTAAPVALPSDRPALATVTAVANLHTIACAPQTCTLFSVDGVYRLALPSMTVALTEEEHIAAVAGTTGWNLEDGVM